MEVLGESDSTEVRTLREALKQARHSAQEQPISAQIKDTEEFIARSTNRLQVLAKKTQRGGAIAGECHSPFGQVARVGHVRPTTSIPHSRFGCPSLRVEGKVGRYGSGTRCTSEGGRCTEAARSHHSGGLWTSILA